MSLESDRLFAQELQERIITLETTDSDIEEVDFKIPIVTKVERPRKPPKVKRSNPHSNLDEDYINRIEKLMHPQWDTLDPTPDTLALFQHFDGKFFQGRLKGVSLDWSKHMLSCAGITYVLKNTMQVTVRLSEPLLKPRPRKDLVDAMLHQMIHAYLFLFKIRESNCGHGPYFKKIMSSINKVAGTTVSTNHLLKDEMYAGKLHWWRCNGICQDRGPFFGYVQTQTRSAPDNEVQWYARHHDLCGGTFMRIKSPEFIENPKKRKQEKNRENQAKRRRSSGGGVNSWVAVDEEVMFQDCHAQVILLSSDDEKEDDEGEDLFHNNNCNTTNEQKNALIKKEIVDESIDLCSNDFELIGDINDDSNNNILAPTSSANIKLIEQFYGDQSLLVEFKNDNDCRPSSSRYQDNPEDDIIKCYICEDKLSRRDYGQHLMGCAGISRKILPHRKTFKKLSAISKEARPRRPMRPSSHTTRDILRNAGYTEAELARISSADETENDDDFIGHGQSTGHRQSTNIKVLPEVLNISSEDDETNTIRHRQRNLYKTTRECPVCNEDVEESQMNTHLDICLLVKKTLKNSN